MVAGRARVSRIALFLSPASAALSTFGAPDMPRLILAWVVVALVVWLPLLAVASKRGSVPSIVEPNTTNGPARPLSVIR